MKIRPVFWFGLMSFVIAGSLAANAAETDAPWAGPAFAASPADILKAATILDGEKGFDATVLLDERKISLDSNGSTTEHIHLLYRVDSNSGVKSWSSVGAYWAPWHQQQPELKARVITSDGVEHVLDPKTLSDTPAREDSAQVYTDTRIYRGPLPAVAVGAVVEEEITIQDTAAAIPGGVVRRFYTARRVPVRKFTFLLEAPSAVPLKYELRLMPNAVVEKNSASGTTSVKIVDTSLKAIEQSEPYVPSDTFNWPQLEFSTVPSWQQAASSYQQMAEPQIRLDDVRQIVSQTIVAGDSRADKIRKLTATLHKSVRYTGIEFGESSLVPQPPAEVLQRKYGDCKEKAATLVAMLRAAEIPAYMALLKSGDGQDVSQSLPGDNMFNHAIVFVPGKPDMWIDATDEFSSPGQLPVGDQGKLALVIREKSAAPIKTPVSAPIDNLLIETREFHLNEFGPARVIEDSESHGNIDRFYRSYFGADRDSKKIDKELEDYVKDAYRSDVPPEVHRGDGADLTQPFLFRLEATKAKRGYTSLRDASVAILIPGVVGRLPEYFRRTDEDLDKEKARVTNPLPPRTVDFVLPVAFVTEWRYKIIAPSGFKVRGLPENRTQDMGPAKFSQTYSVGSDGVVNAVFRFDTVKSRYTAAEADALRKAVVEMRKSKAVMIAFDQTGYALLSAGKSREAVNAFDELVKLHPNEALHHVQIADGLLEGGLGEAARTEAQEAVRLEPNSALAHRTYGWILEHDLIGRRFGKGCDLPAAVEQYRKAVELEPDDLDTRIDFAILLEYDANADRYSEKSDLKGAIEQYRELKKRKSSWDGLDNNLLFALFYARQFKDIEELVGQLPPDATRTSMMIAATAATEGSDAGIKKSFEVTSDEKTRMDALTSAAKKLISLNQYKEAADLFSKVNTGGSSLELINVLRSTVPYKSLTTSEKDAPAFVQKMLTLIAGPATPDPSALDMFVKAQKPKLKGVTQEGETAESLKGMANYLRNTAGSDFDGDVRGDILLSNMKITSEGDENAGYRITVRCLGLDGATFFVAKDEGHYHILPPGEPAYKARMALAASHKGDLASARKWLDWEREDEEIPGGDDPLDGPVFARIWRKGQNADKAAVERASAVLLTGSDEIETMLPTLLAGREQAAGDMQRTAYDMAIYNAYSTLQRWSDARGAAERLLKSAPDSATAFRSYVFACVQLKDWQAIDKAIKDRLERTPDDQDVIEVRTNVAEMQNKIDESLNILRDAIKTGKPRASLLNNYAWDGLFVSHLPDDAIEAAQQGVRITENKSFGVTHTLAAVYAEVGRVGEARQLLVQAMDNDGFEEPNPEIWYVFGRIAEQYGRNDAALSAYKRVEKPVDDEPRPNSTYILAQRGIQRIGASKK